MELSGKIISVSKEEKNLILEVNGEHISYTISAGDADYLEAGDQIRGKAVKSNEKLRLERIWPNNRMLEKILNDTNRTLRRETERMGRTAFRQFKDPMPTFAFYNQRGELIQSSMLLNKITVLNFIFTRCRVPTMCPASTERLRDLLQMAKDEGVANIQAYSITLDPRYDTPGILNEYAKNKGITDPDFHFLTGPAKAVEDMKKHHGIETRDDDTYGIYHTMMTVIIDPRRNVYYQIPGSFWSADDYLKKILKLANG